MCPAAQNLGERIREGPWLRKLENVSVDHGVSLLRWRSGGVEHPHDTPPYPFMPSPTFAHSSRERVDHVYAFRDLECSKALARPADHVCLLRYTSRLRYDHSFHFLAPAFRGYAYNGDFCDVRVRIDRILHFRRVHVFSARDNHVLQSIMN